MLVDMKSWTMAVWLTRDLRGGEHAVLVDQLPNLASVGYEAGRSEASLIVEVEASDFSTAQRLARQDVERVLDAGDIDRVEDEDAGMRVRQVMLWVQATRRQLRRWEVCVARFNAALLAARDPDALDIWSAEIERHLVLVAARNLVVAVRNAHGRFGELPKEMVTDLTDLRNVHEHWDEHRPAFADHRNPGPLRLSGASIATRHPRQDPYASLAWSSISGPRLGPGVSCADLHAELNRLEAEALAEAPDLQRFVLPVAPSPWTDDQRLGGWIPRDAPPHDGAANT